MIYSIYSTTTRRVEYCENIAPENVEVRLEYINATNEDTYAVTTDLCTEKYYVAKYNEDGTFSEDATPEEIAEIEASRRAENETEQ